MIPLDCRQTREELVAFDHGELSEQLSNAVRDHLSRCAACQLAHSQDLQILQMLEREPRPLASREFLQGAVAAARRDAAVARQHQKRTWFAGAGVLAAGLLAGALVFKLIATDDDRDIIANLDVLDSLALLKDADPGNESALVLELAKAAPDETLETLLGAGAGEDY